MHTSFIRVRTLSEADDDCATTFALPSASVPWIDNFWFVVYFDKIS